MQWSDALGKRHDRYAATPRIVSLVPSLTELLVALGLAEHLVGRTGFCIHPRQVVRGMPKLGGTKGFRSTNCARWRRRTCSSTSTRTAAKKSQPCRLRAAPDRHPPAGGARQPRSVPPARRHLRPREAKQAAALSAAFEREWAALSAWTALPRQRCCT
jgi:hypothetical protein